MLKFNLTLFCCSFLSILAVGQTFESSLEKKIEDVLPHMITHQRHLHQYPELAYQEEETAAYIAKEMEKHGYKIYRDYGGGTGVVALTNADRKPDLAIRADIDALPVKENVDIPWKSVNTAEYDGKMSPVAHACGHDVHTATSLALAELLANDPDFDLNVMFIFQPAEEGGKKEGLHNSGARQMLEDGIFADLGKPDFIFSFHVVGAPVGLFAVRPGERSAASAFFSIKLTGKQGHASAPWSTKDPITCAAEIITKAQTIVGREVPLTQGASVISFGMVQGGIRENIIPEEVTLKGTIRNLSQDNHELVLASLEKKTKAIAEMNGVEAEIDFYNPVPPVVNDDYGSDRVRQVLAGISGAEKVITPPQGTGYEDVSYFHEEVPGVNYFVGVWDPEGKYPKASNHSPDFYADDKSFIYVLGGLTAVVYDYARQPYPLQKKLSE